MAFVCRSCDADGGLRRINDSESGLGAGSTGLSTAAHAEVDVRVLEATPFIGGKARTRRRPGASF